jgi:hypothetical protein
LGRTIRGPRRRLIRFDADPDIRFAKQAKREYAKLKSGDESARGSFGRVTRTNHLYLPDKPDYRTTEPRIFLSHHQN